MSAVPIAIADAAPVSLEGFNGTVPVPNNSAGFWRKYRAFVGPALLVSVGYMDPGNWATDLEAGARFKYDLLWVVAASSFMAIIMQLLSARLGIVTGKDLAQACRDYYPSWTRVPNWLFCEVAICACDLAEVIGSAVAIHLLFPQISIFWAVLITALDVFVLLALQGLGMRFLEALILVLVSTIGGCYFLEIFVLPATQPSFVDMGTALLHPGFRSEGMLPVAIGILGATVMPHNLYLHSALVRSRKFEENPEGIRTALRFNALDTILALFVAFFINAAILVLAAQTFYGKDLPESDDWITKAYETLPLLSTGAASVLFALALLASGQSSTITGTLAGQVVMEGFMHWRLPPWIRRMGTRAIAIVPAILVIGMFGDDRVNDLLVLTQIVLALQLPFAMVPLLHFTTSKKRMGDFKAGWVLGTLGWVSCALIISLIIRGMPDSYEKAREALSPSKAAVSGSEPSATRAP